MLEERTAIRIEKKPMKDITSLSQHLYVLCTLEKTEGERTPPKSEMVMSGLSIKIQFF
jgi:hypothetical protein